MPNRGGGSEGGLAKDQTFSGFCFVHPSLRLGVVLKNTDCEFDQIVNKRVKFDIARIRCTFARRLFASLSESLVASENIFAPTKTSTCLI